MLVHDETNRTLATMLVAMEPPTLPVAIGVIYCNPAEDYVSGLQAAAAARKPAAVAPSINGLLRKGHTWTID